MADLSNGDHDPYGIHAQLERFRKSDQAREALLVDLVNKFGQLDLAYREKCQDLENEVQARRSWQNEAAKLKQQLSGTRQTLDTNPFALVLIDGDGAVFQDALLVAAADGGSDAAHRLLTEIRTNVQERYEGASSWTIVVQIYSNLDGLARKLASVGIIKMPSDLIAFARAFTLNQPLFNFVDVGVGKERADHKIKEMLRLFINNSHCKQVFFGGCHDNGYLPNLDTYKHDTSVASRITLLETTPMQPGFKALNFNTATISSVFRSTPLPESAPPPAKITLPLRQNSASVVSPAPFTPSSVGSNSPKNTYATVGKLTGGPKTIAVASSKGPPRRFIQLNAEEQRIDPLLARPERAAVDRLNTRIQKNKVCNDYHLRGACEALHCPYSHGEKLVGMELLALRNKARMRSCTDWSWCRDFDCFYGHHCPNENCFYENCYFAELHNLDKIVKYKIYEDGQEEEL